MKKELQHTIDQYLAGQLSPEEIDKLWAQLVEQPEAYTYLKIAATGQNIVQEQKPEKQPSVFTIYGPWIAAAASVILVITILFNIKTNPTTNLKPLTSIQSDQFETGNLVRSDDDITAIDSLLRTGMQSAIDGDIEQSKNAYTQILSEYPEQVHTVKARINLGIIEFNDRNYRKAESYFKKAANTPSSTLLEEKAYWYLANTYILLNEIEKARDATLKTYSKDGDYRQQSFILLKKLNTMLGDSDVERSTPIN